MFSNTKRAWSQIQKKTYLQTPGLVTEAENNNRLHCGYLTCFAQEPRGFSSPCTGHRDVDIKQIDCQIFLQKKKGLNSGSAENLGSANIPSHVQVPARGGEHLYEGTRKLGGLQSTKSLWLFISRVLATNEEESVFFPLGSAVITMHGSSPFWSPNSNWGFCLLIFYNWDPHSCNKRQISRRKTNSSLLTCIPSVLPEMAQTTTLNSISS